MQKQLTQTEARTVQQLHSFLQNNSKQDPNLLIIEKDPSFNWLLTSVVSFYNQLKTNPLGPETGVIVVPNESDLLLARKYLRLMSLKSSKQETEKRVNIIIEEGDQNETEDNGQNLDDQIGHSVSISRKVGCQLVSDKDKREITEEGLKRRCQAKRSTGSPYFQIYSFNSYLFHFNLNLVSLI